MIKCIAVCALALSPAVLRAFGTTMGPYGLGAAALGAGGAAVATSQGNESFYWNPAGLASQALSLGYDGGLGGPAQSLQQAVAVSGPLDVGLSGGLFAGDQVYPQADNYHEDEAGLGLAAGLSNWGSIGTVQRLVLAGPGGLTGWAMDVGALGAVPLGGAWRLDLGLSASDLFSDLNWANGLSETQPTVLRAGLAIESQPGTWLSAEEDQMESLGEPNVGQWRLGFQVSLFGRCLAFRLGATQADRSVRYLTVGLGLQLPSSKGPELDYAVMVPENGTSATVGGQRQLLSLQWRFGPPPPPPPRWPAPVDWEVRQISAEKPTVKPRVVLKGLLAPTVSQADFDLSGLSGGSKAAAWELRIVDASGKVLRTLRGVGPPPKSVHWEGTDDLGDPVSASAGSRFEIRLTDADGQEHLVATAPVVPAAQLAAYVTRTKWAAFVAELYRSGVQRDPATGGLLYTFYFDAGRWQMTRSDWHTLDAAATIVRLWHLHFAVIDGYAAQDEEADAGALSEARAGTILKALVLRHVALDGVTLRYWGSSHPAATGDAPAERDRNRRVKLHIEFSPPERAACIGG